MSDPTVVKWGLGALSWRAYLITGNHHCHVLPEELGDLSWQMQVLWSLIWFWGMCLRKQIQNYVSKILDTNDYLYRIETKLGQPIGVIATQFSSDIPSDSFPYLLTYFIILPWLLSQHLECWAPANHFRYLQKPTSGHGMENCTPLSLW